MKAVDFQSIARAIWDELVASSPDAWLTHRADWISLESKYFVARNLSFGLVSGERLMAIQPLYLSDVRQGTAYGEILVHSGIHRHTGLALSKSLSRREQSESRSRAMLRIRELAAEFGADRIQLNSHNLAPINRGLAREDIPHFVVNDGFHLGLAFGPTGMTPAPGLAMCNADQIIDLTAAESELFDQIDGADRSAIRKAERGGLTFDVGASREHLSAYLDLAAKSAKRTGETLPAQEMYEGIFEIFGTAGQAVIAFAKHDREPIAGLLALCFKGSATYFAGVSDPSYLSFRPNDFLHWHMMLWLKAQGAEAYRLGPWFPDVPANWPIARVSAFKAKFGAKSVPIIQGSLFLKPERFRSAIIANLAAIEAIGAPRSSLDIAVAPSLGAEVVAHHLRLVGHLKAGTDPAIANPFVTEITESRRWGIARRVAERGGAVILLRPEKAFRSLDLEGEIHAPNPNSFLRFEFANGASWATTWSLHATCAMEGVELTPILTDQLGRVLWGHRTLGAGHLFLIGTDLAGDLTRLRQGDPTAASNRPTEAQWGIAGERPTYLFEKQLVGRDPKDRPADWWIWGLRTAIARHSRVAPEVVLPFGAAGAIVVTGDDDQAPLADYRAQRIELRGVPTTYFLHPLTKHDAASMFEIGAGETLEWELHPDALDTPSEYPARLTEQTRWFQRLTGRAPRLVRNHGFLNDGYWGHTDAWLSEGIIGSSNLPGLDGTVLNGSLLPARLALGGALSPHWSLLTAFGDGVAFVLGWNDRKMFDELVEAGRRIKDSGVPGVLVLNLHPANVARARAMHRAVHHLIANEGFSAMTLGAVFDWFATRDRGETKADVDAEVTTVPIFSRLIRRYRKSLLRTRVVE